MANFQHFGPSPSPSLACGCSQNLNEQIIGEDAAVTVEVFATFKHALRFSMLCSETEDKRLTSWVVQNRKMCEEEEGTGVGIEEN